MVCLRCAQSTCQTSQIPLWGQLAKQGLYSDGGDGDDGDGDDGDGDGDDGVDGDGDGEGDDDDLDMMKWRGGLRC